MPEFKSKKDHAYEDWQTKERCKIEIKVKGEILEWLPRDLQLIFGDGDGLEKIRRSRFAMAINELLKLKFLWNGQDPQARLRIRRTCVFPLATKLYGCETWILGKTTLQRINAFEMKCYRKFF